MGVFDSGVGGLTVLRALRGRFPDDHFVYLGDTARLPYGTKSSDTIRRYALQAAGILVDRGIDALVVACNTASAQALPALVERWPELTVLGVVEPGADAAVARSRRGEIAVLGTESTVAGGAYQRAIAARAPSARVRARACSVFVALAEEGWFDDPAAEAVARAYLDEWFGAPGDGAPDTVVLGCTHFPVLAPLIGRIVGADVALVDSAETTAAALGEALGSAPPARPRPPHEPGRAMELLATDGPERFARVGTRFLGEPIAAGDVQLVEL